MPGPEDDSMAQDADVDPRVKQALFCLHYGYPTAVFAYYIISTTLAVCTLQTKSAQENHGRRRFILWLLVLIILTFVAQLIDLGIRSFIQHTLPAEQDIIIGLLSSILVFGVEFAGLVHSKAPVWYPFIGSFVIALLFEPLIAALSFLARPPSTLTYSDILTISITAARYLALTLAVAAHIEATCSFRREKGTDAERQGLLKASNSSSTTDVSASQDGENPTNGYGSTSTTPTDESSSPSNDRIESPYERRQRQAAELMEKRLKEKGNWVTYAKSFMIFFPYVWPVGNRGLQFRVFLVGCCLLAMNFIHVLIPRQIGIVMDSLGGVNHKDPWAQVLIFAGLKLIASEAGISLLRQWLWIPVESFSTARISTAAYSHVLNLSSDFHDSKSCSDVEMAIMSGTNISNMLESICFQAIPMLIDMGVAFIYLSVTFGPYEGFITIATATVFCYITTIMLSGLKEVRKSQVSAYFEEHYVRHAGIQGWTTVSSFNQIGHEETRYSNAVNNNVKQYRRVLLGYYLAYAFQSMVLLCGLLAGAFLAVSQITKGQATPGQFVMLLTYWSQLVSPLTFFASLGKSISGDLIRAESLLEIMQMKPTVLSKEGAPPLDFQGGHVQFENVSFSYDKKKPILKDVNFQAAPGTSVAFVGATGAGKSTMLKLLDRFYDITGGSIKIDGQDIRDVDLFSLRAQIGVVPQNPILFDDTIMNNVRYAKLTATDEEVHEACKAASIHEQILTFTDGYQTRVGERGVKLSGGELQRVAIARAILKRPAIVLLDEATSAVDTETEQKIQEALGKLCKGRTTFIVAHRLSTIMNADKIMVVTGGEIVEEGSHEDLIQANGKYAELWSKQIFIKPKAKDATETKPASVKKVSGIVNDLTPDKTKSEMAKVKSSTALKVRPANQQDYPATEAKDTPNRQKEHLKLNPAAPTFTPRSFAASSPRVTMSPMRLNCNSGDYLENMPPSSPARIAPIQLVQQFPSPIIMVPAPYQSFQTVQPPVNAGCSTGEYSKSMVATSEEETSSQTGPSRGATPSYGGLKYPVYSRRIQSKSEPLGPSVSPSV
ncbi:hypothetical protein SMACR_02948 [Sordaria macrospora]|uniref:Heavy metal tolerance protein n=1 Tax=Sordaria macrospora TaxID=5147 RepID=A0A8S8ZXA6_SORMA|nr:hypothetical protein SMACR_02948 [Sordaria macrospora]WPJ58309.1 hypothetical protein SMAC4_02948 [Sordaria macrospora]